MTPKTTNVLKTTKTAKTAKMTPETAKMIENCQNGTQISQNDSNLSKRHQNCQNDSQDCPNDIQNCQNAQSCKYGCQNCQNDTQNFKMTLKTSKMTPKTISDIRDQSGVSLGGQSGVVWVMWGSCEVILRSFRGHLGSIRRASRAIREHQEGILRPCGASLGLVFACFEKLKKWMSEKII